MWRPVDAEFFAPRTPVGIISLGGGEAAQLRSFLESLQCVVRLHWIGTPGDFLKAVRRGDDAPPYLIIEGHGDEGGLLLGEYDSSIDASMLVDGVMPPSVIRERADLPGSVVINLACFGGSRPMAEAFLAGGAGAYIGCRDQPDSAAAFLFAVNLMYNVIARKMAIRDAWLRAVKDTGHEEIDAFSFFHSDGTEERFERDSDG